MRRLTATLAAFWLAVGSMATAENNPVVVELFTSQGCSSCPPADAILAELGDREDVIALALHVDYWDYIGWKDVFAHNAFTKRQKAYARTGGWKMIYTPQMVINGVDDVVGSKPMELTDLIRKHAAKPSHVDLDVTRDGAEIVIRAESARSVRPCDIHVIRYDPQEQVKITRGENAGRVLTYTNIARSWDVVARWNGQGTYEGRVRVGDGAPVVVIVQDPDTGHIVAASRLR